MRKKFVQPGGKAREETVGPKSPGQMDLFGQADAVVKHVLEVRSILIILFFFLSNNVSKR